jgi:competence protein ComEA
VAAALLAAVAWFGPPGPSAPAAATGAQAPTAAGAGAGAAPGGPAPAAADGAAADGVVPAASGLLVEVTGAVARPGMYRVPKGERVSAAIAAAGGLGPDADPDRLPNMAARLKDGQQVLVPRLGRPARSGGSGTGSRATATVSLDTATAEQLAAVPGFSSDLAAAVVDHRTRFGGFASTRELVTVLQMSEADYQLAKPYVRP